MEREGNRHGKGQRDGQTDRERVIEGGGKRMCVCDKAHASE